MNKTDDEKRAHKKLETTARGRQKFEYNGHVVYEWDQTLEEVRVYVRPPPQIKAKQISCTITSTHLALGLKGADKPFIDEDFFSKVKLDESSWMMSDGEIEVNLQKVNKAETWESALKGHGELNPFVKGEVQKHARFAVADSAEGDVYVDMATQDVWAHANTAKKRRADDGDALEDIRHQTSKLSEGQIDAQITEAVQRRTVDTPFTTAQLAQWCGEGTMPRWMFLRGLWGSSKTEASVGLIAAQARGGEDVSQVSYGSY